MPTARWSWFFTWPLTLSTLFACLKNTLILSTQSRHQFQTNWSPCSFPTHQWQRDTLIRTYDWSIGAVCHMDSHRRMALNCCTPAVESKRRNESIPIWGNKWINNNSKTWCCPKHSLSSKATIFALYMTQRWYLYLHWDQDSTRWTWQSNKWHDCCCIFLPWCMAYRPTLMQNTAGYCKTVMAMTWHKPWAGTLLHYGKAKGRDVHSFERVCYTPECKVDIPWSGIDVAVGQEYVRVDTDMACSKSTAYLSHGVLTVRWLAIETTHLDSASTLLQLAIWMHRYY